MKTFPLTMWAVIVTNPHNEWIPSYGLGVTKTEARNNYSAKWSPEEVEERFARKLVRLAPVVVSEKPMPATTNKEEQPR